MDTYVRARFGLEAAEGVGHAPRRAHSIEKAVELVSGFKITGASSPHSGVGSSAMLGCAPIGSGSERACLGEDALHDRLQPTGCVTYRTTAWFSRCH